MKFFVKIVDKIANLFLLPGNLVCDLIGVEGEDHRLILRAFTNLLVYSAVALITVLVFFV